MNAKPRPQKGGASCRTWESETEMAGTLIFRAYHQEVAMVIPATATNDGTTPFSRKKYTRE